MAISAAEEETLEALKKWWDESGKSLATGLAVAALLFLGWQQYQGMQTSASAEASAVYETLITILADAEEDVLDDAEREQSMAIIQRLKADYADSVYARFGALIGARLAAEQNDLERAESELRWLLDNSQDGWFARTDESLVLTTQWRLARVLLAQGRAEEARALISGVNPGSFAADFAELRGDIHFSLGELVEAQAAWEEAAELSTGNQILEMKLNSLDNQAGT
ncbi:MAG: tetratricopeptide repeat protein [Pseudomonadales bacterium]|nr:tetratricopeptide repeat protein [Pseudomonadales bacterium]